YFPKSLGSLYAGNWSFGGGLITVSGKDPGPVLATVTASVARGASTLPVSATAGIKAGDWGRVVEADKEGSLFKALYGGMHPGNVHQDGGQEVFHHYSRVAAVGEGHVTLERPLPFPVDTAWTPQVRAAAPTTREVGVERLTLEMAGTKYAG